MYPVWADKTAPWIHGSSNENIYVRHGRLSYELLVREDHERSQTLQTIVIAFDCSPYLDGKSEWYFQQ